MFQMPGFLCAPALIEEPYYNLYASSQIFSGDGFSSLFISEKCATPMEEIQG